MQLQAGLVVDDVLLEMDAPSRLLDDGGHHPRVRVPGVRDTDPAGVVEVALPVDGLDPGAGRALDDEVGVARPQRRHSVSQLGPVGQNVGGVLIHSSLVSPPASLRQRCGRFEGKVSASPGRARR